MSFSILNILTVLKIGSKMLPMHLNIFWNNFPTKHIFDAAFVFPDCSGPVLHTIIDIIRRLKHYIITSAANRSIGEVVQSRRRPLLGYYRFHIYDTIRP